MMSIGSTYCNVPGRSKIDFAICEISRNKLEIKSGKWIHNVEMMQRRKHDLIPGIIQPRFAFFSSLGVLGDILHSGAIGHILSVSCCSYTIHVCISRSLAKRAVLAVRSRRILPHCASPEGTLALRKFVKISSSIFVPIFIGISRNLVVN